MQWTLSVINAEEVKGPSSRLTVVVGNRGPNRGQASPSFSDELTKPLFPSFFPTHGALAHRLTGQVRSCNNTCVGTVLRFVGRDLKRKTHDLLFYQLKSHFIAMHLKMQWKT